MEERLTIEETRILIRNMNLRRVEKKHRSSLEKSFVRF